MTHDQDQRRQSGPAEEHRVLADRLKQARDTLGLTQADTAEALGIARSSVAELEAAKRKVSGLELRRLSRLYQRSVAWLLGEEDESDVADQALYRATSALSPGDKEQVLRFAEFLAAQRPKPGQNSVAPRSRPTPPSEP
ncbi:helix-turn-helix transcriptional regulator [Amycolatopsis sp., V23-08]|uniref:Helix-turn-helix transcriptional regulator n=1 Tax=Amycolatopsis heterodermiae TaxID=3110235 RepID=A0ABU5QWJ4_9PSEU|nr:helix-turn-helix transcriptional regulator [Amycolatopsis sp., V23-08]MEA5358291.1 helix-turn-helix transcriptional regulator [Amycolatopsis sp., V23-08]